MIYFVLIFQITNALKETLSAEYDRKVASPTESAARWKQRWEHSGADHLKPSRVIRTTYVTCREWTERSNILLEMSVCQSGWYRGYELKIIRPGIQKCIPGLFVSIKICAPEYINLMVRQHHI